MRPVGKKRLLVTGGSGFVGSHAALRAAEDWRVFATFRSHPMALPGVTPASMDLEDERSIEHAVERVQPDAILHTAVAGNVDWCEGNRKQAFRINAAATEILAESAERAGSRFVYVSSDMVFDGKKGGYAESDETGPVNYYGLTKLAGERFVAAVHPNYAVARSALIYGSPGASASPNSFSHRILERVLEGEEIPLFTDQFRSPILVQDLADALLELAGSDFVGTIHIGGAERTDRYAFGLRLAEVKGFSASLLKPCSMFDVSTAAPRPQDVSLNTGKAAEVLSTRLRGYREGMLCA